jgi:hypothetical protein
MPVGPRRSSAALAADLNQLRVLAGVRYSRICQSRSQRCRGLLNAGARFRNSRRPRKAPNNSEQPLEGYRISGAHARLQAIAMSFERNQILSPRRVVRASKFFLALLLPRTAAAICPLALGVVLAEEATTAQHGPRSKATRRNKISSRNLAQHQQAFVRRS